MSLFQIIHTARQKKGNLLVSEVTVLHRKLAIGSQIKRTLNLPLLSLFLFICTQPVRVFIPYQCCAAVSPLYSLQYAGGHIQESRELQEVLRRVCHVRRDKDEVTQRGTGSGTTEGGDAFHLQITTRALMHSAHKYSVIEIKSAKVTGLHPWINNKEENKKEN